MAKRPNLGNYVAPWEYDQHIARLYRDMELNMINSLKRNLAGHKGEEIRVGTDFTAWQSAKLRELKRYQAQNKRMMTGYTDGMYRQLGQTLREEFRQGIIGERSRYEQAKGVDALQGDFFTIDDRKVTALIGELHGSMRAANSAALRKCSDVYRQVIFDTTLFASNGVLTEKQAFDSAMKKFTERGIDCIVYADGRRVNIADYSSMAIRTAHLRANLMGAGEFRQQLGEHLIQITKHGTSCKLCKPWETKILIDDVYSGGKAGEAPYPTLSEAMQKGLYHPNCRHGSGTYYPELDEVAQEVFGDHAKEKAEVAHAENQVQKFKRLSAGCLDPKLKAKYDARLWEWENILKSSQGRLTAAQGSGKIQTGGAVASPEQYFVDNLQKNSVSQQAYADALKQRFSAGTLDAKRAFEKFVPLDSVADGAFAGGAHYSPADKRVRMDYAKDAQNTRGGGTTYFHEHGHLIDDRPSGKLSSNPAFVQSLRDDFKSLIQSRKAQHAGWTQKQIYTEIEHELFAKNAQGNRYSSVSDILEGLSTTPKGKRPGIRDGWGHDAAYWQRKPGFADIESEAFAHLFEAQFDAARLKAFQEYFPTAVTQFDSVLKGVI